MKHYAPEHTLVENLLIDQRFVHKGTGKTIRCFNEPGTFIESSYVRATPAGEMRVVAQESVSTGELTYFVIGPGADFSATPKEFLSFLSAF